MKKGRFQAGNVLEGYRDMEGRSDHPVYVFADGTRICLTANEEGGLEVRAEEGKLMVSPRYSNSVYVSVVPLFPRKGPKCPECGTVHQPLDDGMLCHSCTS